MSRNSSGTYTLPAANPVVSLTTITSSWANTTMSDIATELTNSLDRAGRGAMTAALGVVDGSVSAPGLCFSADTNNGFYRDGVDTWHASAGGTAMGVFSPTGVKTYFDPGTLASPSFSFIGDSDTGAFSPAAGKMRFTSNGVAVAGVDSNGVYATNDGLTGTLALKKYEAGDGTYPNYGVLRNLTGEMVLAQSTTASNMRFWVGTTDATAERMRITPTGLVVTNSAAFNSEFVITTTTGAASVAFTNGNKQVVTLTGAWTPTFTFPGVGSYQVRIISGAYSITWPAISATWQWLGSPTAPALNNATYGGVLTLFNSGSLVIASYAPIGTV